MTNGRKMDSKEVVIFNYLVIFREDMELDYEPVIRVEPGESMDESYRESIHLLDQNLIDVTAILEFILHLPRLSLDLYDLNEFSIDSFHDTPHMITMIPDSAFLEYWSAIVGGATAIFVAKNCLPKVFRLLDSIGKDILVFTQMELTTETITSIWNILLRREGITPERQIRDAGKHFLLQDDALKALPVVFLARQYGCVDEVMHSIFSADPVEMDEAIIKEYVKLMTRNNALVALSAQGVSELHQEVYERECAIQLQEFQPNVVLSLPGISSVQRKLMGNTSGLTAAEIRVIRFMGIHRAIARKAILIEHSSISEKSFVELNKLEIDCQNDTKLNAWDIDKRLKEIGREFDSGLSEIQKQMLYRNRSLTVLSDFPIGLAIPPHQSAPLFCSSAISYRPLTPLTRSLTMECAKVPQRILSERCRVLFVDCVENNDRNFLIKKYSNLLVETLKEFEKRYPCFLIDNEEANTTNDLLRILSDSDKKYDILYLSAHGFSDRNTNMAGIYVGNEPWLADGNSFKVPKFVVLSACHTSPRGTGCVSIADLLIRAGADAVLSALVPVQADSNMKLMTRLFVYIAEAQKGERRYETLADAWSGIVAGNAILEICQSSKALSNWLHERKNGKSRIEAFQQERAPGKLRRQYIYEDTIQLIKDMMREEGVIGKFANVLEEKRYYPESYFYQMIGFPENIILYNKYYDEMRRAIHDESRFTQ